MGKDLDEKLLKQATPVVEAIKLTMKNDRKTRNKPAIVNPNVLLADSSFLGSPPEVIIFIPERIMKKIAKVEAKVNPQNMRLAIKGKMQLMVATPSTPQFLSIIKD